MSFFFPSSCSHSRKFENGHFSLLVWKFWTIRILCGLSKIFGKTYPWTCAYSDQGTSWEVGSFFRFTIVTFKDSKLCLFSHWTVVWQASYEVKFYELLCYLCTDLRLEKEEDRKVIFFWSNSMKRDSTIDPIWMLLGCTTIFSLVMKVVISGVTIFCLYGKMVFFLLNLEKRIII